MYSRKIRLVVEIDVVVVAVVGTIDSAPMIALEVRPVAMWKRTAEEPGKTS